MKVVGFDGRTYNINFKSSRDSNSSSLHCKVRLLLREIYPSYRVYEEILLPGSRERPSEKNLYADFFISALRIIVEVHGQQHYEASALFHGKDKKEQKKNFNKGVLRDSRKQRWCELNNITLIELPYNEESEWRKKLSL